MNQIYAPGHARGALWNDAAFNIGWPALPEVVGVKDKSWPPFDVAQDGLE
jgi:dTDP-4-dehydrorhamnose 3,5-epimerase-like enzyme